MLRRIDDALDEWRHHTLVDGDAVRDLLLDLRAEAQMLDTMVELAAEPWQDQALILPDLSN